MPKITFMMFIIEKKYPFLGKIPDENPAIWAAHSVTLYREVSPLPGTSTLEDKIWY